MGANYTRNSRVNCVTGNALVAAANTGQVILPPEGGRGYIIMGGWVRAVGNKINEATTVNICSTAGTPIVGVAVAKTAMGSGVVAPFDGGNVTRTTYGDDNLVGKGLKILTVGTDETTATSIDYCVEYVTTGA